MFESLMMLILYYSSAQTTYISPEKECFNITTSPISERNYVEINTIMCIDNNGELSE